MMLSETECRNLTGEFTKFGKTYSPAQLSNIDWCSQELARLGYAISITYITREYAKHLFGREPSYPEGVEAVYSYRLWGPRYPKMGDHMSPIFEEIHACMVTALFNVVKLDWEDVQDAAKSSRH